MIRLRFLFAWYDLWVGLYYDRSGRKLYVFPLPMLGFVLEYNGCRCPLIEGTHKAERL